MSAQFCARKALAEVGNELAERFTLLRGAGVGRSMAVGEGASNVGYAYGAGVVSPAVGAGLMDRASGVDGPVESDEIVVTYCGETAAAVPFCHVGNCHVSPCGGGSAMDDYCVDCSHSGAKLRRAGAW